MFNKFRLTAFSNERKAYLHNNKVAAAKEQQKDRDSENSKDSEDSYT